ncbi:hypothetical protein CONLIGDRAFT_626440 [Coniochaeta ligniaria NRRL 30616]|uniref:Uncharacterized protein n=1 Tax=Coniochaeta ligniaria NRRL 30616 TaxID=1408157 RepID=A0A1J7JWJ1_9PEZI|nr:hypothetical protein CONLIGDRAFT_626440 [Coniochaeta ligniaria NRRL 30616]
MLPKWPRNNSVTRVRKSTWWVRVSYLKRFYLLGSFWSHASTAAVDLSQPAIAIYVLASSKVGVRDGQLPGTGCSLANNGQGT